MRVSSRCGRSPKSSVRRASPNTSKRESSKRRVTESSMMPSAVASRSSSAARSITSPTGNAPATIPRPVARAIGTSFANARKASAQRAARTTRSVADPPPPSVEPESITATLPLRSGSSRAPKRWEILRISRTKRPEARPVSARVGISAGSLVRPLPTDSNAVEPHSEASSAASPLASSTQTSRCSLPVSASSTGGAAGRAPGSRRVAASAWATAAASGTRASGSLASMRATSSSSSAGRSGRSERKRGAWSSTSLARIATGGPPANGGLPVRQ